MWARPQLSSLTHPLSVVVYASIVVRDATTIASTTLIRVFMVKLPSS